MAKAPPAPLKTKPLRAPFWGGFISQDRLNQAAGTPFRSIHIASGDNGKDAVAAIHGALELIANNSILLIFPFMPKEDGDGLRWGPYSINASETVDLSFGTTTDRAVQKFQRQAGLLADGKVGLDTFARLDEMLVDLDSKLNRLPSPFDF